MRAARWHARNDIRIDHVDVPEPLPDQALLRVLWCGICGSDLEEYFHGPLTVPVGTPHPTSGRMAPITLGHEIVAMVERAAVDGSGPPAGTVVLPDVVVGCGCCWWCLRHEEGLCPRLSVLGQHDDGGLAEYLVARAETCVVVPDGMDPAVAALGEPAAVAVRAIRKLPMPLGARIAVLGGGTIGQLVAQVARAAGAMYVLVVDPIGSRRQIAYDVAGVSACAPEDVDATVRSLPQPGLDAVIECTGKPGLVNLGLRLVRQGGTVVCLGMRSGEEAMTLTEIVLGEKHVIGSAAHLWDTDVADAVTMLSDGRIVGQPLITHRVGLDDLVSVGFAALDDPASGALKVIVDCAAPGDGR